MKFVRFCESQKKEYSFCAQGPIIENDDCHKIKRCESIGLNVDVVDGICLSEEQFCKDGKYDKDDKCNAQEPECSPGWQCKNKIAQCVLGDDIKKDSQCDIKTKPECDGTTTPGDGTTTDPPKWQCKNKIAKCVLGDDIKNDSQCDIKTKPECDGTTTGVVVPSHSGLVFISH